MRLIAAPQVLSLVGSFGSLASFVRNVGALRCHAERHGRQASKMAGSRRKCRHLELLLLLHVTVAVTGRVVKQYDPLITMIASICILRTSEDGRPTGQL